ncbi:MAG: CDP-glycerol glycerophosphotransferase family protein [Actinomycetia bacterium]|nr:CDP-glycerol glycerophosphotransferase family protein [Actinomycetes bacterium]
MSAGLIEHIRWRRAYLDLELSALPPDAEVVVVSTDDPVSCYPLRVSGATATLFIPNVTGEQGHEMLTGGSWYFALRESSSIHPLALSDGAHAELESASQTFHSGHRGESYQLQFRADGAICKMEVVFAQKGVPLAAGLLRALLQTVYRVAYRSSRHDGTRLMLLSETKNRISGNLLALDLRLRERGLEESHKIVHRFQETLRSSPFTQAWSWFRLVILLARQDVIFIDDYAPIFNQITLGAHTLLCQVWHAGVGFKAVGYARFGKEGSPQALRSSHRHYDRVVVGSTALIEVYQEVFALPAERFLATGLPRIDLFLAPDATQRAQEQLFSHRPGIRDKRRILFAPTYRGTGQAQAFYPYEELDFAKIAKLCGDDTVFLIKMHPFITQHPVILPEYADRIIDVSGFDVNELLLCADFLVTDYSSVIYEYSLLDRPMCFFAFDLESYEGARGFHWDYEQIAPGPVCRSFDELLDALQAPDHSQGKREAFRKLGFDHQDCHNADRLIDAVINPR